MRRRFFLVDNPLAGRGRHALPREVEEHLADAGATVARCEAGDEEEVFAAACDAARSGVYDAVVAAGGDGTIRLIAKAVAATDVPLGVISLGTGNVLAHEVGLPRDGSAIARMLLDGPDQVINTATANGELFLLMVGIGFDGSVIAALDQDYKTRFGKLAYVPSVLQALGPLPSRIDVRIDGVGYAAHWAVVANARCYGGAFVVAPGAGIERPGLVAVLVEGASRSALAATLVALAIGRLEHRRNVRMVPCRHVVVHATPRVPVQIDGDRFGMTPVSIQDGGPRVRLIMPAAEQR